MEKETRFLRLPAVLALTGLSKSQTYHLVAIGQHPAPIKLSARCSAFVESEVRIWMAARIAASRKAAA